jgi:hypothetical protein
MFSPFACLQVVGSFQKHFSFQKPCYQKSTRISRSRIPGSYYVLSAAALLVGLTALPALAERPLILSAPPVEARAGHLLQYSVAVSNADQGPLQFKLRSAPAGASISSAGILRWTPTRAQFGKNEFFVSVSNEQNEVQSQFLRVFVVDTSNSAPSVPDIPAQSVTVDEELSVAVTATDSESDSVRYSLEAAPPGASINPLNGQFVWTPATSDVGKHTVVLLAQDGFGGKTHSAFDITVTAP